MPTMWERERPRTDQRDRPEREEIEREIVTLLVLESICVGPACNCPVGDKTYKLYVDLIIGVMADCVAGRFFK